MPRGKAKFSATSPDSEFWRTDPERALTEIAERHNAKYKAGSLLFTLNGRAAEAIFETVEPDEDSPATQLFRLGADLDAMEFQLFLGPDRWGFLEGGTEQAAS